MLTPELRPAYQHAYQPPNKSADLSQTPDKAIQPLNSRTYTNFNITKGNQK